MKEEIEMTKNLMRAAVAAVVIAPALVLGSGIAAAAPPKLSTGGIPGTIELQGVSSGEVWQCTGVTLGSTPFDSTRIVDVNFGLLHVSPNSNVSVTCISGQSPFVVTQSVPTA